MHLSCETRKQRQQHIYLKRLFLFMGLQDALDKAVGDLVLDVLFVGTRTNEELVLNVDVVLRSRNQLQVSNLYGKLGGLARAADRPSTSRADSLAFHLSADC